VSFANFHNAKVCEDLLDNFYIPIIIGETGYAEDELVADRGTSLVATLRKNMKKNGIDYHPIKAIRKTVETVFSGLQLFGIEHLKAQIPNIMTRIHLIVLLDNLLEVQAHRIKPWTLKFSKGIG
jgi:hypothetical protein